MAKIPEWVIVLSVLIVGTILSLFVNPVLVWAGVAAASVGIMLLGSPYWLLMVVLGWSMTAFVWESIFPSSLLKRVDDLMIVVVLAVYLGNLAFRRLKSIPYMRMYLVLLLVALFSKVLNGSGVANLALFALAYCAPYLLFCLVYVVGKEKLGLQVLIFLVGIFLFGVALNFGWLVGVNPIYNIHRGTIDFAKATFGSCDNFSYYVIFIIFLMLSVFRVSASQKRKIQCVMLIGVALLQLYLTYTNHAYLYFAALFLVYLVIARQRISGYIALSSLAFIVIVLLSTVGQSRMASEMGGYRGFNLTDPRMLTHRLEQFQGSHKVDLFHKVVTKGYHEGILEWLVGHGPGAGVGTVARNSPSDYTFKMLGDYYLTYSGQMGLVGSSITQNPWSGISSLWSEVGLVGTLLFFMMPLIPAKLVFRRLLVGYYDKDPVQRVIAESFVMFVSLFFVINLMKDFWSVDSFVFPLWVLAALALREPRNISAEEPRAGASAAFQSSRLSNRGLSLV